MGNKTVAAARQMEAHHVRERGREGERGREREREREP